jgi:hypothetical protein
MRPLPIWASGIARHWSDLFPFLYLKRYVLRTNRVFTPLAVFATKAIGLAIPQSLFPREDEVVQ